ncbi:MAG: hypothetical protein M0T80_02335 [Actinomycetota bacterium]|nr:hypothetical protein [Actinomycetota bacterium]
MYCQRTLYQGVPAVRKEPASAEDVVRLERERRWLDRAAHPGVVRLLPGDAGAVLWTRDVGERSLASLGRLDPEVICGLGAAAATVLADLHDLGIVHGAPRAEHVLVDGQGRPVLCSFGRASAASPAGAREDVRILARALMAAAGADVPRRLTRLLADAAGPAGDATARHLARGLARGAPTAVLAPPTEVPPGPDPPLRGLDRHPLRRGLLRGEARDPGADRVEETGAGAGGKGLEHRGRPDEPISVAVGKGEASGRRRMGGLAGAAGVLLVLATVAAVVSATMGGTHPHERPLGTGDRPEALSGAGRESPGLGPPGPGRALGRSAHAPSTPAEARQGKARGQPGADPRPPSSACPGADAGCRPVSSNSGIFSADGRRWRLSQPFDLIALGRWACGPSLPAALDPRTGQLWVFSSWTTQVATPVAIVPGATSLGAVARGARCDLISVARAEGGPVVVDPLPDLALATHG